MDSIKFKELNEILAKVTSDGVSTCEQLSHHTTIKDTDDGWYDSDYENSYGKYYEVYKVNNIKEDLYLKVEFYTDSYGDTQLEGMKFVKPKVVQVVDFEEFN
jgi:hypothetical protein